MEVKKEIFKDPETQKETTYAVISKPKVIFGKFYDENGIFVGTEITKKREVWISEEDRDILLKELQDFKF